MATQDFFAGTGEPVGAEDAWMLTGILIEEARLQGFDLAGGSADAWNCFDQIQIILLSFPSQVSHLKSFRPMRTFMPSKCIITQLPVGSEPPIATPAGSPRDALFP